MDRDTCEKLLEINRRFYQSFGKAFATKRTRPQPGVLRILSGLPQGATVLDLGCGHGLVAEFLARAGHTGRYLGVDLDPGLLQIAHERAYSMPASFRRIDLAKPGWAEQFRTGFDMVCAFAVLHHIPDDDRRAQWAGELASMMSSGSAAALSVWDFLSAPSLRERILPWEVAGLDRNAVDAGDYLLDWREQGSGMRYVHSFTEEELERLAHHAGLSVRETFHSDGRNGRLGLYQIWTGG